MECPTDDMLGALVQHALDATEAARVTSHIDTCEMCRAAVVAAMRAEQPQLARGTPSLPFADEPAPSLVGKRMGRYEIRALIGAGGMGQVYSAYDAELDRQIAVKILRPELARTASVLADRLLRESRLMAKVAHPAVITVYDVGRQGDAVFIAMELIRGETLGAYVAREQPDWKAIAAIFEIAGQGLAAAHDAGIVHRDFKPDNVLVEAGTKVIVTDFGIATAALADTPPIAPGGAVAAEDRLTATGIAVGTPAYMAPEQLGAAPVDRRADVFAFSVALWEALFGERPFRGKTVDEIRAAMRVRPKPPRAGIPARLVRALERGLAVNPDDRWPDMRALLRELAASRSNRRTRVAVVAAGGAALVGLGIAGALLLSSSKPQDPCAMKLAVPALGIEKLAEQARAWNTTHAATCRNQPLPVATCLQARKREIESFVEEAQRDPKRAPQMLRLIVDPARCANPPSGLLVARVPEDPALRRKVNDLRYRAFEVEAARDRIDFAKALPAAKQLVAESTDAWPPVRAELLYLLGTTQAMGADTKAASNTLREAAVLAERAQHDYIAANSWIQLVQSTAFDEGDSKKAMEYAANADAALDRIGRPPDIEVLFLYFKGSALEADSPEDAEAMLRRAIALAEKSAPQYLARAILGLGFLFENEGRYADAVDMYRKALKEFTTGSIQTSAHTFRERLAINLSLLGQAEEAEAMAREAVAIAERTLGEDNIDRAVVRSSLAQVLQTIGKPEQALVEARLATRATGKILGERSERFGETLSLEGSILVELERFDEANKTLGRACEIIAFTAGDDSQQSAECLLSQSIALDGLNRGKDALAIVDRGLAILMRVNGEEHPSTASALVQRGALRDEVGRHAEAVADLEKAIAIFEKLQLEPGHLGGAKWALGKSLWKSDRPRAKQLVEEAIALFAKGSDSWAASKAEAEALLRSAK